MPDDARSDHDEPPRTEATRYEDIVERLETLVEQIESGELDLEQSIRGYEEGTALIKQARAILAKAEQRVAAIDPDADPQRDDAGDDESSV